MIRAVSVSEFIEQINGIVTGEFIVEGEVSQYKISQGKWVFFDLKDERAALGCFSSVFSLRTPLEDGMKIRVTGYPSVYPKTGRFSFTVQRVEMVGQGSLKRAYELLKAKLEGEGLFDQSRKRILPSLPNRIGVIASRDSAAYGDFKRIINNRWAGVEILLRHVQVQGEQAVNDIVSAFRDFNEYDDTLDVVVLIRGGGSLEDLMAFNDERVVRAVYGSRAPVICGVGHERDETLADLAADVRASTPSNAAEVVVPERKEFFKELDFTIETMGEKLTHKIRMFRQWVEDPRSGMLASLESLIARRQQMVGAANVLFKNVDPRRVLKRGFSITRDTRGHIIRSADQVDEKQTIVVELAEGTIQAAVSDAKKK